MGVQREIPKEGQESAWDYPRPPACVASTRAVEVRLEGAVIAFTRESHRVLETSHPPTWYLPRSCIARDALRPSSSGGTVCEWKGQATYWDVVSPGGRVLRAAAWSYESPSASFEAIRGALAFYPGKLECFVDGERVRPQEGGFYGGWVTDDVVGPFKGSPGTRGW